MKKSVFFPYLFLFFSFNNVSAQDTLKIFEFTQEQVVSRVDSGRILAIHLILNTPDTLGVKDSLLHYLSTANIYFANIGVGGVFVMHGENTLKVNDIILATTQGINYLNYGVFENRIATTGYFKPYFGLFINSTWIRLGQEKVPVEEIAFTIIHELVHFAQKNKIGRTVAYSSPVKKLEVQAWWFESFVYFSNHPEIQQSPFSNCDKEEIKSFFKKNDFTIKNRMRCVSSCTNTFLEVLGY